MAIARPGSLPRLPRGRVVPFDRPWRLVIGPQVQCLAMIADRGKMDVSHTQGGRRMPHPRLSSEEIKRRGMELYERNIRAAVETEDNIGKLVSIDVETGDYEVGDDSDLDAPMRLHAKRPGAAVYTLRIGNEAVYALGGVLERTGT